MAMHTVLENENHYEEMKGVLTFIIRLAVQ